MSFIFLLFRPTVENARDLENFEQRLVAMSEKMNAMRDRLQENEGHVSQLQVELHSLREQSIAAENDVKEMSATIAQLNENKEHLSQLQGELQALRKENAAVESSMNELKSVCGALSSELKKEIEREEVSVSESGRHLSVSFIDRILFDFGSASITSDGREILSRVGKILKASEAARIRIAGHTDDVPILAEYKNFFPSNWELSAARAAAVVRYLQETGVDPRRMEAVGRSFQDPLASNETEEGRAKNRRVEIILAPELV